MKNYIDIHTHIMPEVDDGAKSFEESLELLKIAYQNGTNQFVLTPHYRGSYKNYSSILQPKFEVFSKKVAEVFPDIQLYLGTEIHYDSTVAEKLTNKQLVTLNNTQYCLLELSNRFSKSKMLDAVYEVVATGFIPIIAHIEHYDVFRDNLGLVAEVINIGAFIQVNADSILGKNGLSKKRYCKFLLKNHCVHFVASDCHDVKYRPPLLNKCYNKVSSKYGTDYANKIFCDNQKMVLCSKLL